MSRKIAEARLGTGISEQEYYKAFLEDFINDLITTLYAGIRGGTIDLGKTTAPAIPKATGEFDVPKEPEKQHNLGYNESRYSALNKIFEAIIVEQENEGTLENAIEDFFAEYVKGFGADYSRYKPQINAAAKKIADGMKKDMLGLVGKFKGGNHVSKATQRLMFELGNIAYSVYRLRPKAAAKPQSATATSTQSTAAPAAKIEPASAQEAALVARDEAQKALMKLKQLDPGSFASLLKTIS